MHYCRILILSIVSFLFVGCGDLAKEIIEQTVKESHKADSLKTERAEFPISKDRYEYLERKRNGIDSLYLVRSFYLSGQKYADSWFTNKTREGVSTFYYPNGNISHIFFYRNGLLTDLINAYFPDGTVRNDSKLKNGNGNIKIYHPITLKLIQDCDLKNGYREGKYMSYYAEGQKYESCSFINDSVVGEFTSWFKSGKIETQRRTINGKTVLTDFYPNSDIKKSQISEKGIFLSERSFDEHGNVTEEISVKNDKVVSIKRFYSTQNRLLTQGTYVNGKMHGDYEYFHENGSKKAIEHYEMGEMTLEKRWHENGNLLLDVTYKDGEYHGVYKDYYPNGKLQKEQHYVKGIKQGKYVSYFDNGNKYNEGVFVDGKPKGPLKIYTRDGKFDRIKEY